MRGVPLFVLVFIFLSGVSVTFAQDTTSVPVFAGQIAYIGSDFNVYVIDGAQADPVALTEDAGRRAGGVYLYQWPTWARDGRLAYFGLSLTSRGDILATDTYVAENAGLPGLVAHTAEAAALTYAYWSPQNCLDSEPCLDLAVLLSRPDQLTLEVLHFHGDDTFRRIAVAGAPLYFSWSPDGARILWNVDGRTLAVYDVVVDSADPLVIQPGRFGAPAWSPVDDRLLLAAAAPEGSGSDLVILANDERLSLLENVPGTLTFAWSPDGNHIAYATDRGSVHIIDALSGAPVAQSPIGTALAYFWSPDSAQIAFVTQTAPANTFSASAVPAPASAAAQQGIPELVWWVMDVATGNTRRLASFRPTRDMVYLLAYFDQFAQSHRLWSPDSRHLVYGEVTADARPVVTLLDTTQAEPVPLTLAEGSIGIWSFEEAFPSSE